MGNLVGKTGEVTEAEHKPNKLVIMTSKNKHMAAIPGAGIQNFIVKVTGGHSPILEKQSLIINSNEPGLSLRCLLSLK